MKLLKKIMLGFLTIIVALTVIYFLGPKPEKPSLEIPMFKLTSDLVALEQSINESEKQVKGLRPENEAKIFWADSTKKQKTKLALLYLHGFGASRMEGYPVNIDVAKTLGCNIFMARLAEHGINAGEENYLHFTADEYVRSAEYAYQVAKQLGDSVVILGTSAGGAMGLFLCSKHPEISAILTYSPAIKLFRNDAQLLAGPWGLELAQFITGKYHNDWEMRPGQEKYWTDHQRFEGIIQFANFIKYAMVPETFSKIKCPVFMGYYYENEEKQDMVVSVKAMNTMFEQLGTPKELKRKIDFKNAKDHVITSNLLSSDWKSVQTESINFIKEFVLK